MSEKSAVDSMLRPEQLEEYVSRVGASLRESIPRKAKERLGIELKPEDVDEIVRIAMENMRLSWKA